MRKPSDKLRKLAESLNLPIFMFSKSAPTTHKELDDKTRAYNVRTIEDLGRAAAEQISRTGGLPTA